MQKMLLMFVMFMGLFVGLSVNAQEFIESKYVDPKGTIVVNESCDPRNLGKSITVQGLGNKILDLAGTSRYWVESSNPETKREVAYAITRASISDDAYTGNQDYIEGMKFFYLDVYVDGFKAYRQVTAYRESCFVGAIKFDKWSRDEKPDYTFDMDIDENNRLRIINNKHEVYSLTPSDTIMEYIPIEVRNKRFVF